MNAKRELYKAIVKNCLFILLLAMSINLSFASRIYVNFDQPYTYYSNASVAWVPGHWYYGRWIPGHYVEYARPAFWYEGGGWDRGYYGHGWRHHHRHH